jgi:tetratricopeptide (TPR) repeat protein
MILAWLLFVGSAVVAPSQTRVPLHDCAYDSNLDARIAACTDAINAGKLEPVVIGMAYNNRGQWYADKGERDRAIADFTSAIKLDRNQAPAYFHRARLHAAAGRKVEAIADFRKVLELQPGQSHTVAELKKLGVDVPPPPAPKGGGGGSGGGGLGGMIFQ